MIVCAFFSHRGGKLSCQEPVLQEQKPSLLVCLPRIESPAHGRRLPGSTKLPSRHCQRDTCSHIFLMSKSGFINAPLTVGAAKNQYFRLTGGDNAAHCGPGQIYCGGQAIQKLLTINDDVKMIVECLFSKTDGIEKKFLLPTPALRATKAASD